MSKEYEHNLNCQICARLSFSPILHHINGNHNDNNIENQIILCSDCHTAIHHGIGCKAGRKGKRRKYGFYSKGKEQRNISNKLFLIQRKIKELQKKYKENKKLIIK